MVKIVPTSLLNNCVCKALNFAATQGPLHIYVCVYMGIASGELEKVLSLG